MKNLSYNFALISLILGFGSTLQAENVIKRAGNKVGDTVKQVGQAAKDTAQAAKGKVEQGAGRLAANVGEHAIRDMGKDAVEGAKETVKEGGKKVGGMFINALTYLKHTLMAYTPEPVVQYLQEHPQAQTALVLAGGAGLCWFLYNYGATIATKVGQTTDYILDTIKTHKKKVLVATILAALWYANQNGYFPQEVVAEGAEKADEWVESAKEVGRTVADKAADTASQVKEGAKQLIGGAKEVGQTVADKASGAAMQVNEHADTLPMQEDPEKMANDAKMLIDCLAAAKATHPKTVYEKTA